MNKQTKQIKICKYLLGVNAMESQKSLYDIVVVDSKGIEMDFAIIRK